MRTWGRGWANASAGVRVVIGERGGRDAIVDVFGGDYRGIMKKVCLKWF